MSAYAWAQLVLVCRRPVTLSPLAVVPLYGFVLFSIASTGALSSQLATSLTITASVMTMWTHAIFVASDIVDDDRYEGTLEAFLTSPSGYRTSLIVRVVATAALALPAFVPVAVIGGLTHGVALEVRRPAALLLAWLVVMLGTAAAALALGALLLLVKGARTLQNAVTYPFYLFAGLVWPVAEMPGPLQALAQAFYLSWAVEALRSFAASEAGGWPELAIGTALTAVTWAVALLLLGRVLSRLRHGMVALHG